MSSTPSCAAPALLRAWREKHQLSQAAAAERVGVRQNTWSDWEHDRKKPQIDQALALARECGVAVAEWETPKRKRAARRAA